MLKNSIPFFFVLALTATTVLRASEEHQKDKEEAEKKYGASAKKAYLAYRAAYDQCIKSNHTSTSECKKFAQTFVYSQHLESISCYSSCESRSPYFGGFHD